MSNWKTNKLIYYCTKIGSGATPRGGDASYKDFGISLIRSQNILDFTFSNNGLAFIDEKQAKELSNVELKERDVLINITGDSVARVCQVPNNILPARVNQHVAILRANQKILSAEFLKYYLLEKKNKERLLSLASTGATRKALTKTMLEEFAIDAPEDIKEQQYIASILSSFDNKIELNRRMNETMQQIASTLFKKYFVDDIDSDNLPEGWKYGRVGDVISVQNGYAFKSKDFLINGSIGIIKIKNINNNVVDIHNTQFVNIDTSKRLNNNFSINSTDVLIAMTGAEVGKIGMVPKTHKTLYLNQRVGSFKDKIPFGKYFCFVLLTSDAYQQELQSTALGSAQPNISSSDIENIKCILPPLQLIKEFGHKVNPMFDLLCNKHYQNFTLANLRDTLLPKLMSGEFDVTNLHQNQELHEAILS